MLLDSMQMIISLTAVAVTATIFMCGGKKDAKEESKEAKSEKGGAKSAVSQDVTTGGVSVTGTVGSTTAAK